MRKILLILIFSLLSACAVVRSPGLQPFSDVEYWVVRDPLVYEIGNTGQHIIVPEGFVTDFASVPPSLRALFPKLGKYLFAAIVHDYLYWNQTCSKGQADEIFFLAMKESGVGGFNRYSFFAAVDKFGSSSWDTNKKNKANGAVKVIPRNRLDIRPNLTWGKYSKLLKYQKVKDADTEMSLKSICNAIEPYIT